MSIIGRDLNFSVRMLLRNPFYALVAVIAIALGIGANTAIFSVVNAVLLRPLPFNNPEQLVEVRTQNLARESKPSSGGSPADFWDWQDQSQKFEQMTAIRGGGKP